MKEIMSVRSCRLKYYLLSNTETTCYLNNIQVLLKIVLIDLLSHNFVHVKTSVCARCMHTHHHAHNQLSPAKYPKLVPVSSVVCKSFILFQCVCEVDPPCYLTIDISTVKNEKYFTLCYNVTSVTSVKVCNFFVSSQNVFEVRPIHVDVEHVASDSIVKHWNEISLC